jgi:PAS domain-containing protein
MLSNMTNTNDHENDPISTDRSAAADETKGIDKSNGDSHEQSREEWNEQPDPGKKEKEHSYESKNPSQQLSVLNRDLLDKSPIPMIVLRTGKVELINSAGMRMFGAENLDEVFDKPLAEFIEPDHYKSIEEKLALFDPLAMKAFSSETRLVRPDGSTIDALISALPHLYEGEPAIQLIICDVTSRAMIKIAETSRDAAKAESNLYQKRLIEAEEARESAESRNLDLLLQVRNLEESLESAEADAQSAQAQLEAFQANTHGLQSRLDAALANAKGMKKRMEVAQANARTAQDKMKKLQSNTQGLQDRVEAAEVRAQNLQEKMDTTQANAKSMQEQVDSGKKSIQSMKERMDAAIRAFQATKKENKELKEKLNERSQVAETSEAEMASLKERLEEALQAKAKAEKSKSIISNQLSKFEMNRDVARAESIRFQNQLKEAENGKATAEKKLDSLEKRAKEAEELMISADEERQEIEEKYKASEEARLGADSEIRGLRERCDRAEKEKEAAASERAAMQEKMKVAEGARRAVESECKELKEKLEKAGETAKERNQVLEKSLEESEERMAAAEAERDELRKKLEAAEESRKKAVEEKDALKERFEEAEKEKDSVSSGTEELQEELKEAEAERGKLREKLEKTVEKAESANKILEERLKEVEGLRTHLEKEREELETKVKALEEEKTALQDKLDATPIAQPAPAPATEVKVVKPQDAPADRTEEKPAVEAMEPSPLKPPVEEKQETAEAEALEDKKKEGEKKEEEEKKAEKIPVAPVAQAMIPAGPEPAPPSRPQAVAGGKKEKDGIFYLRPMLDRVCERIRPVAQEKGLELTHAVNADVPEAWRGDAMPVQQILIAIAENAVKFTEQGEVKLHVASENRDGPMVRLHFFIKDTGMGMSETDRQAINAFFDETQEAPEGATKTVGMGMTMVKKLLAKMDGNLQVEGEEEKGTIVDVSVLLKAPDVVGTPAQGIPPGYGIRDLDGPESKPEEGEKAPATPAPPLAIDSRLLLVIDETNRQEDLEKLIEGLSLPLDKACGMDETRDALQKNHYGMVFMAVNLFCLGDVAQIIQARQELTTNGLPIVALLDQATDEERNLLLTMGLDRCITRPFDADVVRNLLCELLEQPSQAPVA